MYNNSAVSRSNECGWIVEKDFVLGIVGAVAALLHSKKKKQEKANIGTEWKSSKIFIDPFFKKLFLLCR